MVANCYNCGFKAVYKGGDISNSFELYLGYLGVPIDEIRQAKLEILSKKLSGELSSGGEPNWFKPETFNEIELPPGSRSFSEWLSMEEPPDEFMSCLDYLIGRGRAIAENWDYHWCPGSRDASSKRLMMNHRVIIPFTHNGRIVGYTGRYAGKPPAGVTRYHNSNLPAGYLFNADVLYKRHRKFVLVLEGPFDAIAVDGVSPLGSTLNKQQISWLQSTDAEKIVVPDREAHNQELIDEAIRQGWSVSFPDWEHGIKDAADASARYGRLYTVSSIIKHKTTSELEISVKRKLMKG